MHAIRLRRFGGPEELRHEKVDDVRPGPGQARVAVRAAGVHLLDTRLREGAGDELPFRLPELPITPGREVAGVVDAVGDGVEDTWIGRRVVTHLGLANGGYADLAVREVAALHEIPAGLGFSEAVAMIGSGRTALAVLDAARIEADDVVLVTAAAGGMGTLFVQAARNAGATVVGAAGGADKTARVRGLGADVAVDYTDPDWPERVRAALTGRQVTVVLESVGGDAGRAAFELLGPGGRMLVFGWSSGGPTRFTQDDLVARALSVSVTLGPALLRGPGALRSLEERSLAEAGAGRLVPAVTEFPLAEAAAAHRALESRATVGKVVLVP
jgi:NADPH2:quinone reductase